MVRAKISTVPWPLLKIVATNADQDQRIAFFRHIYSSPSFYKFPLNPNLIYALSVIMSVIVTMIVIRLKHGHVLST
jgi:hypothetical protein